VLRARVTDSHAASKLGQFFDECRLLVLQFLEPLPASRRAKVRPGRRRPVLFREFSPVPLREIDASEARGGDRLRRNSSETQIVHFFATCSQKFCSIPNSASNRCLAHLFTKTSRAFGSLSARQGPVLVVQAELSYTERLLLCSPSTRRHSTSAPTFARGKALSVALKVLENASATRLRKGFRLCQFRHHAASCWRVLDLFRAPGPQAFPRFATSRFFACLVEVGERNRFRLRCWLKTSRFTPPMTSKRRRDPDGDCFGCASLLFARLPPCQGAPSVFRYLAVRSPGTERANCSIGSPRPSAILPNRPSTPAIRFHARRFSFSSSLRLNKVGAVAPAAT